MISRLLLAVDDSVDSLAAARLAVELAREGGRHLRAVHVSADGALDEVLRAVSNRPGASRRRDRADAAVLSRVRELAAVAGVEAETVLLSGEVGRTLLDAAREWPADLVVVGKSARSASGEPYVGTVTRHLLEFCEQPVLVVPPPTLRRRS